MGLRDVSTKEVLGKWKLLLGLCRELLQGCIPAFPTDNLQKDAGLGLCGLVITDF